MTLVFGRGETNSGADEEEGVVHPLAVVCSKDRESARSGSCC